MRGEEDGWIDEEGNCVCKKEGKCSLKGLQCLGVKGGEGRILLFCTSFRYWNALLKERLDSCGMSDSESGEIDVP